MDKQKKGIYEKKAKDEKIRLRGLEKQTTTGESVDKLEERRKQEIEEFNTMITYLTETLRQANDADTIDSMPFYVIHTHYHYKKVHGLNEVEYFPAELAVCRFSLKSGIEAIYHERLSCEMKLGYMREHLEHSENTHKLNYNEGESDYKKVYEKLTKFINPDNNADLPPLYTIQDNVLVAKCLLTKLAEATGEDVIVKPRIYSLEWLFSKLYCEIFSSTDFSHAVAINQIEKDPFSYTNHLECEFHRNLDIGNIQCSMSIVKRWVFTICDYICEDMEIERIPGCHLPADLKPITSKLTKLQISATKKFTAPVSASNVSSEYREKVTARSGAEDKRRREESKPVTIIDYSSQSQVSNEELGLKFEHQPTPSVVRVRNKNGPAWGSTSTVTLSSLSDSDFPAIGGSSQTSSRNENEYDDFPKLGGRGIMRGRGRGKSRPGRGKN